MRTLAVVLLTACATTTTAPDEPGSRGLRASGHLDAAREQDELSRQQMMYPDVRADGTGSPSLAPWTRTWDSVTDHDRLAQIHRGAAAELHAEYDEACGSIAADRIPVSPIQRYGIGGSPTEDGAIIYLSPDAGPADRLLRDMRCHRAWMMLAPSGMDSCPLDLAGIHVTVTGDAENIAVTITVRDRNLVEELQRRAASELETNSQHVH